MDIEDLILVSVDDHIVEPPDMFDAHVPDRWRDQAPRSVRMEDGSDVWVFEGIKVPNIGLNAVVGRPKEEYGWDPTAYTDIRPGCYDHVERVKDMNLNGVLSSMCFPSFVQFCGQLFSKAKDKEMSYVMLRAYNDWHIDEWCGSHPGRFIPLSIPPIWDPELMAAEVARVAAKGCTAVTFSEDPSALGWPSLHSEHWDPFYRACVEHDVRICLHIGSSSKLVMLEDAPMDVLISLQPVNSIQAFANVLWSPVLKRFPDLRFALSEGGIGWLPYALERVDYVYQQHRFWTKADFGDKLPSERAREVFTFCFIDDKAGVAERDRIGIDNITWECDYPHSDSTWPHAPEMAMKHFAGVSDEEINKITHLNAMKAFRFDPFQHIARDAATVGALRGLAASGG
ncbi:amidohydrolase family protein [Actinocorallia sp. A-T 12471]|uniref:amidohydrolase family protein n=1 Tax=Actinocorallia sp. A-T 12471 TaxID=3089813 RepID=UPI0029D35DA9|nr:amidohydrolase family protein [Actinocorallia sp. A-T 12471]MDX6741486.1 amidohydrolase family protein [Actinocorallia sp. A-T 12471]